MKKIRRIFKQGDYALRVKRSRTGLGMFTKENIPRGSCIIEYIGRAVSPAEQEANLGKYLFWTGRNTMINGNIKENKARFINHSCIPNCEADIRNKRIYIFAKKNIKGVAASY